MRTEQRSAAEAARVERDMMRMDHEADLRGKDKQIESIEWKRRIELNNVLSDSSVKNRKLEEHLQATSEQMIKQERDHCRKLRETLDAAAAEQQHLLGQLNVMQKQVSDFALNDLQNDSRLFRTITRILIEIMANYEIEKESAKIRDQQNELLGVFWKLEAAFINLENSCSNDASRSFIEESSREFDNVLSRLINSLCGPTSISPDERREVNRVLLELEHAFFIFSITMISAVPTDEGLCQSSFDLLRSILSQMPIVKSNHVEEHVRRSLEELSKMMTGEHQESTLRLNFPTSNARLPIEWNDGWNLESLRNNLQIERDQREEFRRRAADLSDLLTKECTNRVNSIREGSEKARWEREKAEQETIDKEAEHQREIEMLARKSREDRDEYEREITALNEKHDEAVKEIVKDMEVRMKELNRPSTALTKKH